MNKPLTKAEEQIMQIIWKQDRVVVRDVLAAFPEPKPHYNTISTLMKILEEKGFLAAEKIGNTFLFYPIISKTDYAEQSTKKLLHKYFDGSIANMLTFFVKQKDISVKELDKIIQQLKK